MSETDLPAQAAPRGGHDHLGWCALCTAGNGTCCDHCPGNPTYDPDTVQAALREHLAAPLPTVSAEEGS